MSLRIMLCALVAVTGQPAMNRAGKGVPMINLARANKLGLKVKSSVLLSAEVVSRFPWDAP